MQIVIVILIRSSFTFTELQQIQDGLGFLQSFATRRLRNLLGLEKRYPFVEAIFGDLVKGVNFQDISGITSAIPSAP